ncbi:MAG: hypothetical protein ABDH31_06010 [Chlorobiota bacterium]
MRALSPDGFRRLAAVALFCTGVVLPAAAQRGLSFDELARLLESYFDHALIADIRTQLPLGASYEIWGWDAGDFSGDGYPDLALTVFIPKERQQRVRVYAFVDQDGFLLNVAQFIVPFISLPLEVGVAVRDTICYITQKLQNNRWSLRGYRYWLGHFLLWEELTLETAGERSSEQLIYYRSLERIQRRFQGGRKVAERRAIVLPAYPRRQRPLGVTFTDATCGVVDYVPRGAYYWRGPEDAALRLRASYDEYYLYLAVWVADDELTLARCDTCPADMLRLWFARSYVDTSATPSVGRRRRPSRPVERWEALEISLRLGDFADTPPQLLLHTPAQTPFQADLWRRAKAIVSRRPEGYVAKLRLPLLLLSDSLDAFGSSQFTLRFAVELTDVDNEFRPEESSWLCTSSDFSLQDPTTYAELLFLPPGQAYGESVNVWADAIVDELLRLGF